MLRCVSEPVVQLVPFLRIQSRGRLVDDDQSRRTEKRLRDAEALPHAAGELTLGAIARVEQVEALEEHVDGAPAVTKGSAAAS